MARWPLRFFTMLPVMKNVALTGSNSSALDRIERWQSAMSLKQLVPPVSKIRPFGKRVAVWAKREVVIVAEAELKMPVTGSKVSALA